MPREIEWQREATIVVSTIGRWGGWWYSSRVLGGVSWYGIGRWYSITRAYDGGTFECGLVVGDWMVLWW